MNLTIKSKIAFYLVSIIFLSASFPLATPSYSQVDTTLSQYPVDSNIVNSFPSDHSSDDVTLERSYYLSIYILVFGLLIIATSAILVFFDKMSSDVCLKITTVAITATSALFLVVAGYSTQQIAPAFGLLGTLMGYLLGQKSSNN